MAMAITASSRLITRLVRVTAFSHTWLIMPTTILRPSPSLPFSLSLIPLVVPHSLSFSAILYFHPSTCTIHPSRPSSLSLSLSLFTLIIITITTYHLQLFLSPPVVAAILLLDLLDKAGIETLLIFLECFVVLVDDSYSQQNASTGANCS